MKIVFKFFPAVTSHKNPSFDAIFSIKQRIISGLYYQFLLVMAGKTFITNTYNKEPLKSKIKNRLTIFTNIFITHNNLRYPGKIYAFFMRLENMLILILII